MVGEHWLAKHARDTTWFITEHSYIAIIATIEVDLKTTAVQLGCGLCADTQAGCTPWDMFSCHGDYKRIWELCLYRAVTTTSTAGAIPAEMAQVLQEWKVDTTSTTARTRNTR